MRRPWPTGGCRAKNRRTFIMFTRLIYSYVPHVGSLQYVVLLLLLFASFCCFLIIRLICIIFFLCQFSVLYDCFCFLHSVFLYCFVGCCEYCFSFCAVSFPFLQNSTDHCHQLENQVQSINIIIIIIIKL